MDQRVALHLFFQVILGDVEPELVPVSALGVAVQKARLIFAQRVVSGKLGDVLDAQFLLPIAAQGLDPLGGAGVAVVEGFLQPLEVSAFVGLADVGELFEIHLLGVFRRGHPGVDAELFELFQHRLDPSGGGVAIQDHFQLAALGIEVGVRPGAIADPGAVLEGDGVLVPVLHAGVVIEQRPVVDVVGLDGNGAGTDPALGVSHLAAFHLERRFLLGFLRVELG